MPLMYYSFANQFIAKIDMKPNEIEFFEHVQNNRIGNYPIYLCKSRWHCDELHWMYHPRYYDINDREVDIDEINSVINIRYMEPLLYKSLRVIKDVMCENYDQKIMIKKL